MARVSSSNFCASATFAIARCTALFSGSSRIALSNILSAASWSASKELQNVGTVVGRGAELGLDIGTVACLDAVCAAATCGRTPIVRKMAMRDVHNRSNISGGQFRAELTTSYGRFRHTFTEETDLTGRGAFDFAKLRRHGRQKCACTKAQAAEVRGQLHPTST